MDTQIIYCDETGDDGLNISSSRNFILTSIYMASSSRQNNYNKIKDFRKQLKEKYGFHTNQECTQNIF